MFVSSVSLHVEIVVVVFFFGLVWFFGHPTEFPDQGSDPTAVVPTPDPLTH